MFLGLTIIFTSAQNHVEAKDVYVGTSKTTGWDCYAMTETFQRFRKSRLRYEATLKMISSEGNITYLDYTFVVGGKYPIWFHNSQGYSGAVTRYGTNVEWNMYQLIRKHYGD